MTVPEALQDPHLRRYRLRRHRLSVAGGQLSVVAPANGDDLLQNGGAQAYLRSGLLPYWADIWPASLGLARYLMRGPELTGLRVADLGCGIGLAGLAAGVRGAQVVFQDQAEDALRFARFNALKNAVQDLETVQLNWDHGVLPGQFDRLLLADVAYEERNFVPLQRHLECCLAPQGMAILADPYRAATDAFLQGLTGFQLETIAQETSFQGKSFTIRLVQIRPHV